MPELALAPLNFAPDTKDGLVNGPNARIISNVILYRQGRTNPGPKVTPAGYSNHNFGVAFDVGIFMGDKYLEHSPMYDKVVTENRHVGRF